LSIAPLSQLQGLEADLIHAVDSLQKCKRIRGTAPTLEDLNPIEETEIGLGEAVSDVPTARAV